LAQELPLQVFYLSDSSIKGYKDSGFGAEVKWDTPLLEGYNYKFLTDLGRKSLNNRFWDNFNPSIISELIRTRDKIIVVNGWVYSSHIIAIILGKLLGKKVWMRGDNPLNQEMKKSRRIKFIKRVIFRAFFRTFIDKFLFVGKQNRNFFKYYGVKEGQLVFAPHAVDNSYFSSQYELYKGKQAQLKSELGIPEGKKVILFSGKYIKKKRPLDLLRAYAMLPQDQFSLILVGEGELRSEMERLVEDLQLRNVFLTGFVNQSLISRYYATGDVFVMCSQEGETWGLSVNEAMNFSLPVIVSNICGCADDLVKHGDNGFVFETGDIASLAEYLNKLLQNDTMARRMGERSKSIIQDYSFSTISKNILKVIAATPKI
jgi:glycosyltransferase involved in cell wall biosynthesis